MVSKLNDFKEWCGNFPATYEQKKVENHYMELILVFVTLTQALDELIALTQPHLFFFIFSDTTSFCHYFFLR